MSIPQPKRDDKGRVVGDFYPLQREEILALRKAKVINNAAYVHLALRYENPFCDRPIEIFPKEFAMRWQMPESSVYEAIGKLKEIGAINIKYGKVVLEWATNEPQTLDTTGYSQEDSQQENSDSQQTNLSENSESSQPVESRVSEFPSEILDSQKAKRIVSKESESSETGIYIDRARSSDYSNFQTLSEGEREKFLEFGRKKAAKLPNPPELPDEWIAKYFEQIYEQFKKATENQLETSQDEQNKILRRRAEAQDFLSRSKEDSHLDQNSAPPREKSAAPPPNFAEIDKLLNEPEERSEGSKRGANSTGVDRGLVDKLKKKKQQRGFGFRDKKP